MVDRSTNTSPVITSDRFRSEVPIHRKIRNYLPKIMSSGLPRSPATNKGRHRKTGLIALRIAAAIVALIALTTGICLLILRSSWGGERLRRQIVSRVNRQIRGSLDIGRLSFGGDNVVVWDVALRDPDGQVVAQISRAEVDFSLLPLLLKEVRVRLVAIESPMLTLVSDDDGSNLARATAPRRKTPPKPPRPRQRTARDGWVVRLDRFDLTQGEVSDAAVKDDDSRSQRMHLTELNLFASGHYATGSGSLDLALRLTGQSRLAPVGPLRLAAQIAVQGSVYRFDADGDLLSGTLKAHGAVDSQRLEDVDVSFKLDIPRQDLAGFAWGPLRVAAEARPTTPPKLAALLAIPGIELAANDRASGPAGIQGRLAVSDLGLTGRALQAWCGGASPPLAGHGAMDFGLAKAGGTGATRLDGRLNGAFDKLRSGQTVVAGLTFDAQATGLSSHPEGAAFELAIASVSAGTSQLRDIALAAKLRAQEVTVTLKVASPSRVDLNLAGRFDDDRRGLALTHLGLAFPAGRWASEGIARLRFDDQQLSLANFRLGSRGQLLTIDGSRRGQDIGGHLAVADLRLAQLPTALLDSGLRLDGKLNVDVRAEGTMETPRVTGTLALEQARYQGFAKLDARVEATVHDDRVDATVGVEAPFLTANAELQVPTDPLAPGAPIDVKLDVKRLDIAQVLRGAEAPPLGTGRVNLNLHLNGSADDPRLALALEAFDLAVSQPATSGKAARPVDLGHARVHIAYADKTPRAEIDFAAAHGGSLVAEAAARVDLSYPHIKRRIAFKRLPVHGKVVAQNLDVAWIAVFNPQVESLGGRVDANARLTGTVGDPQVLGDVHWKNGELVTKAQPATNPAPR
jgi:hypothetical protein